MNMMPMLKRAGLTERAPERPLRAPGEVIIAEIPFTHDFSAKIRPALVLIHRNVDIVALPFYTFTEKRRAYRDDFDIVFDRSHQSFTKSRLKVESVLRMRPFTIESNRTYRIGEIYQEDLARIMQSFCEYIGVAHART